MKYEYYGLMRTAKNFVYDSNAESYEIVKLLFYSDNLAPNTDPEGRAIVFRLNDHTRKIWYTTYKQIIPLW